MLAAAIFPFYCSQLSISHLALSHDLNIRKPCLEPGPGIDRLAHVFIYSVHEVEEARKTRDAFGDN